MKFISNIKQYITKYKRTKSMYLNDSTIFLYQMGKVGSSSLELNIENSLNIHSLYGNGPCPVRTDQVRNNFLKKILHTLYDKMKRKFIKRRNKTKIITLIRDPLQRNISMFFQDLPYWIYKFYDNSTDTHNHIRTENANFLNHVFETQFNHFYFDQWFDRELKKTTKIDIFKCNDIKEKKTKILNNSKFSILIIKFEYLNDKETIKEIENFTGLEISKNKTNIGEKKWYGDLYSKFKKEYTPSKEYIEKLYSRRTSKAIYSHKELETFVCRYKQN